MNKVLCTIATVLFLVASVVTTSSAHDCDTKTSATINIPQTITLPSGQIIPADTKPKFTQQQLSEKLSEILPHEQQRTRNTWGIGAKI